MKVGQSEVSAIHRLASLYGLKCSAQGGGKKRTVMVLPPANFSCLYAASEVEQLLAPHTRFLPPRNWRSRLLQSLAGTNRWDVTGIKRLVVFCTALRVLASLRIKPGHATWHVYNILDI